MAQRKGGLGKGLEALFADNSTESGMSAVKVKVTEIEPNRNQPRHVFDQNALDELADSIKEVGIIQPLIVRSLADGGYQIVAGERRWRAAQLAGLTEIPVVIRELTDKEVAEFALIENLQREDLDPVEEAEGYKYLISEFGLTQEQVAERVGKSRPAVANSVRLLELPQEVQKMLQSRKLSSGHARALLGLQSEESMLRVGEIAVRKGLTVRDVEKLVKKEKENGAEQKKRAVLQRDSYLDEVEIALSEALNRRVKVSGSPEKGTLEVDFFSVEELGEMAKKLATIGE